MILSLVLSRSSFDRIISERTHPFAVLFLGWSETSITEKKRIMLRMGTNTGPHPDFN